LVLSRRHAIDLEHTLNAIGRRVFDEVWISTVRHRTTAAGLALLGLAAGLSWFETSQWVPKVVAVLFALAATASAIALWRKRFRASCAALYLSGIATVAGFGAVWWCQTSPARVAVWWSLAGFAAATILTACWLGVVLAPLERSQPDMRAPFVTRG
jgi:ABC-type Fe3+-siderophore transport system permease subunit